ncbi:MAG: hypothetical protein ACI95C_001737 [Pseudohongiellaceae bacterium]|jgi:hypothetical protein
MTSSTYLANTLPNSSVARVFFVSLVWLFAACPVSAQSPARDAALPLPVDMSRVHFYLVTVDVGEAVWDNFGHSALRVIDENSNTDAVFNWGYFNISGGVVGFSFNFFKGIMNYSLETNSPAFEFANYRRQQRTVWQDKINLTNSQKEVLYKRLMWNLKPENKIYAYQYFFDNCTTRIRDYLDEALGGAVIDFYPDTTLTSFREEVRRHYSSVPIVDFSLNILMNSNVDRPMTQWENMFLPLNLRQRLLVMPSDVAEDGKRLNLLSTAQELMSFAPPKVNADSYQMASIVLLAPVIFLLLMLKKIPMSYFATHSRLGLKWPSLTFRLLGLLGIVTALFSGVYGTLMLASWFVSDHLDLHHNVNLLLFWPTDLLGIFVALRWLLFCKPWPTDHNSSPFINYYLLAHILAMGAYGLVAVMGWSPQSILTIAQDVAPGFFVYTVLIWLVGFEPAKPKTTFF